MEDFVKKLDFESDTFSDMKRNMNFVLQRLLGNMQEKGATDGSMTLKMDVTLDAAYIPNYDPNVEGETRRIAKPKFKHKVTSSVQIKDEKSGNMDTEMEMVFDEDTGEYVMKPIANTEQRSIFDSDFGAGEILPSGKEEEKKEETGGIRALPGSVTPPDDVIDAEFKEVTEDNIDDFSDSSESGDGQESPEEELEDVTDEFLGDDDNADDDYSYEEPEGEE